MNNDTNSDDIPQKSAAPDGRQAPSWERELLEKLAFATLREQRSRRRWNIFFRLVTLSIVAFVIVAVFDLKGADIETVNEHTALIEINGVIGAGDEGASDVVLPALNRAFSDARSVGVVLRINSPGGSPVQAGIINDEIQRLRKAHPKK